MRALAVTAALIGAVWATVSAQGAGDRDQFFKGQGRWMHHSLKGIRGRHPKSNSGSIDTLATWSSFFVADGVDSVGVPKSNWPFTMVGQSPIRQRDDRRGHDDDDRGGRTTWIPAPIIPVNLELHEEDGSVLFIDGTTHLRDMLKSPLFSLSDFSSSRRPTQYADAIQRAQFFSLPNVAEGNWHTMLLPRIEQPRTVVVGPSDHMITANDDGTCCRAVIVNIDAFLKAMFPPTPTDTTTLMGAAENARQITTRDLSIFLLNNVLFNSNSDPTFFGTGFHNYDSEPGNAANGWREKRYVMAASSWISPDLFGTVEFADIAALSHEIAETVNDPFAENETPWWSSPINFVCNNLLEGADVIETAPIGETFPIAMPNGTTYHPVNVALLPWFAGMSPSPAIDHAYSYPNIGVLTSPNMSQAPGCGM